MATSEETFTRHPRGCQHYVGSAGFLRENCLCGRREIWQVKCNRQVHAACSIRRETAVALAASHAQAFYFLSSLDINSRQDFLEPCRQLRVVVARSLGSVNCPSSYATKPQGLKRQTRLERYVHRAPLMLLLLLALYNEYYYAAVTTRESPPASVLAEIATALSWGSCCVVKIVV